MNRYDTLIIGDGPIGWHIALALKRLDKNVAIITLGNDSPSLFDKIIKIVSSGPTAPLADERDRDGVEVITGPPQFQPNGKNLKIGEKIYSAKRFVLATGASPGIPSVEGLEKTPWFTPLTLLEKTAIPSSITIIGAGPVGVSLAHRLLEKKRQVTLVSNKSGILPGIDPDIANAATEILEQRGATILSEARLVKTAESDTKTVVCTFEQNGIMESPKSEALVFATGFEGNTKGLGLETQNVYQNEKGFVVVNDQMRTSAPHIWAAGSLTNQPMSLAMEEHQANLLVNNITSPFFSQIRMEQEPVPEIIPTNPPIATVGLQAEAAGEKFKDVHSILYKFAGETGVLKLVGRGKSGEILGAHIMAPHAEEIILYFNLAMRAGISIPDLLDRQHYPTPSRGEALYHSLKQWAEKNAN